MAYIYRIINDINDKVYIGKTERQIQLRFQEHCSCFVKKQYEKRPLYSAMKKYGIEHFHIELIEETDNPEEREKYWIEQYGSFKYGYNATIGGDGKKYLDYDLIYRTYLDNKNITKTAQLCNCGVDSVKKIISQKGITNRNIEENRRINSLKPIAKLDKNTGEILEVFSSVAEVELKYPNTNRHISSVCKGKRKSCGGFGWKYL